MHTARNAALALVEGLFGHAAVRAAR